ncbi:SdpA family antimicrobial peptide system protein [Chryseobacterium hagamense]|uniref:SdpA family antimicrobial peptide system protein n=1 Tax=Chryseobacterium hagamense TaxID=395935 RepID=A0A511YQL6_9FLAO|nr:SdpA family antimicrobial peptide system protein [Chryseobacterium hagamense]GEN77486.1 hypothetical protein CHA01nite_32260 [Chryseobacterium hagamense]
MKIKIIYFLTAIILVFAIIIKILSVYFGNNPLNNSRYGYINYVSVIPEGWAFFTKNARDPLTYIFKNSDGNITSVNLRNFSSDYSYGISRHNRIVSIEIGNVFDKINKDTLTKGTSIKALDVDELTNILKEKKVDYKDIYIEKKHSPDLNGKYIFVLQRLLPWTLLNRKSNYKSTFVIYPVNIIYK